MDAFPSVFPTTGRTDDVGDARPRRRGRHQPGDDRHPRLPEERGEYQRQRREHPVLGLAV